MDAVVNAGVNALEYLAAFVFIILICGFIKWCFSGWSISFSVTPGDSDFWAGEATHVYHFYDRQGNLLYVGITNNLRRRWAQHEADKPWWHLVDRKESVIYPTREEAEKVEAHQIRTHRPLFNRAMNGWLR